MDPIVIDQIKFDPSLEKVLNKLHVKPGSPQEELVRSLFNQGKKIARPKSVYTIAGIDQHLEDGVVLNGIQIKSKVMAVNLKGVHRVFPYLNSSGREIYDWTQSKEDLLERYYAEEISQMALRAAGNHLLSHLKDTYQVGKTSSLNPGSLNDWPITGQVELFQLFGDAFQTIGVELTESMLMLPNQSVSGIRYSSETDFWNCELCPRDHCHHRRAPYDETLLIEKYQQES